MEALSLFDFDVEQVYEKPKPKKVEVKQAPVATLPKSKITRTELLERAKQLRTFLNANKEHVPQPNGFLHDELSDTIRASQIQLNHLQKELR